MTPRKSTPKSSASLKKDFKCVKSPRSPGRKNMKGMEKSLENEVVAVLAALRDSTPASLPGRTEHIEEVQKLLNECIDRKRSCSIYIYGAPGRGKTASVKKIESQAKIKMRVAYIDCRKLMTPVDVYDEILRVLTPKYKANRTTSSITKIEDSIKRTEKPTLLIVDEVDRLTESVLYSLLELQTTVPAGKIAIIGVGNAHDFIDKLPLIKNNSALEPKLIEFGSYTKDDIKGILLDRLNTVSRDCLIISDVAIELLAAKTAVFGDARIPLGLASAIIQSAFDQSEGESISKVDPMSVVSAFNTAFGSNEKTVDGKDAVDSLTIPQKFILCSAVLALTKKCCAAKDLTLTHIYTQYKEISAKKSIDILSSSDFLYACRMIEEQGFFSRKKSSKKTISWEDKILLKWDQIELLKILKTKTILSDILCT